MDNAAGSRLPLSHMEEMEAFDSASDPFGERTVCSLRTRASVLGGVFEFESNDASLLRLVDEVYEGLPAHTLGNVPPEFRIRLVRSDDAEVPAVAEPPPVQLHSGAGILCGVMDGANFALLSPERRAGLVTISASMLRSHAHTVRYELIEFAVYTLAARAQQLLSLHAACVGYNGRALLFIGDSGAGKTTLTLHCLLHGMELVAEDAVFVAPHSLQATGIGSFLHLRADSLELLRRAADREWIRRSPVIRRRSGLEKFAVDVRRSRYRIAPAAPKLAGVIFLSPERVTEAGVSLLSPLSPSDWAERLAANQPYAANQPTWSAFLKRLIGVPAFELKRGQHPSEAVGAVRRLVE
jgi:hypothetical protein